MTEYLQGYPNTEAQQYKGGKAVITSMLAYLDELDSEGYEQAMEELDVINSIMRELNY